MLRTLLDLGRVSNLPTVWTNLTAAWLLGGGALDDPHLAGLALGGSLLYLAGMALNDAAGAGFDRKNKPERPIPTGRIKEHSVWILGWAYLLAGALALFFSMAPLIPLAAIVILIPAYTFTHKRWEGCVFFMGGIRACLYLIGGGTAVRLTPTTASTDLFPAVAIPLWATALGIYTILLTRTARCEYPDSKGRPTIPLATFLIPVAAFLLTSTLLFIAAGSHAIATIGLSLLIPIAYIFWLRRAQKSLVEGRIGPAVGKMLAGFVIIDSLAVSACHPYLALLLLALAPLLLLWQKLIPAT